MARKVLKFLLVLEIMKRTTVESISLKAELEGRMNLLLKEELKLVESNLKIRTLTVGKLVR